MAFALGPRAARAGYRLAAYDSIGSTSSEALVRARGGEQGPLWIAARSQNAGRGRRGRAWSTAEGNLAATLLMRRDAPLAVLATLGFVAGLALKDAISVCAPGLDTALKWPNDLLSGNGKLAGILLESEPVAGGIAVAVGIGVNVSSAPEGLPYAATSLAELGANVAPESLFAALSDAWTDTIRLWDDGAGLTEIRRRWLSHAAGVGEHVTVRIGEHVEQGIFETIDTDGRLVLRGNEGKKIPVTAGEVFFGEAATRPQSVRETG